jgi:DNA-binding MarR family transcriptional regulator
MGMELCFSPLREPDREDRVPELVDLFFGTMARLKAHFLHRASELGLTIAQAQALLMVDPDRPQPMRDIAGGLGVDPSNLTGIVDRLEDLGLVERRPSSADRRVKTLALTDEGARRRREIYARAMQDTPFAVLALEEQAALEALLAKVVAGSPDVDEATRRATMEAYTV